MQCNLIKCNKSTVRYLAPEVLSSFSHKSDDASSTASDVFALGVTLNEVLTGVAEAPVRSAMDRMLTRR